MRTFLGEPVRSLLRPICLRQEVQSNNKSFGASRVTIDYLRSYRQFTNAGLNILRGARLPKSLRRSTLTTKTGLARVNTPKDWLITRCYRYPECGKRYYIPGWKQKPKCRVCDAELRAVDEQGESSPRAKSQRAAG